MGAIYKFYDEIKTYYWNNLKLSNIIIAFLLILIIRQAVEFNFASELSIIISTNKSGIYTIIATTSGTLLGFIITSISIIVIFIGSDKLKILIDAGFYDKLFGVYFDTIKFLAITTLIATIGMFYFNDIIYFYVVLFFVIISIFLFCACIWVLESLIKILKN